MVTTLGRNSFLAGQTPYQQIEAGRIDLHLARCKGVRMTRSLPRRFAVRRLIMPDSCVSNSVACRMVIQSAFLAHARNVAFSTPARLRWDISSRSASSDGSVPASVQGLCQLQLVQTIGIYSLSIGITGAGPRPEHSFPELQPGEVLPKSLSMQKASIRFCQSSHSHQRDRSQPQKVESAVGLGAQVGDSGRANACPIQ